MEKVWIRIKGFRRSIFGLTEKKECISNKAVMPNGQPVYNYTIKLLHFKAKGGDE